MNDNNNKENDKNSFWELIKYALVAAVIVIPFRVFIAQPYIVSGSSMDPTFKDGDYLIVDQLSKRFQKPQRGDVVIIRYPKDPSKFFIKRIVGFPNEKLEIKNGQVTVYNEFNEEGLLIDEPYVSYKKVENFSIILDQSEYFVMGDNRAGSSDSRIWGPLPEDHIVGQPIIRLFPFNKINIMPGLFDDLQ